MNTNPMMIYFGQEFGEPGMDHEGFSGRDGRTTIFDYWSVGTIRRWRDGGKFDGRMLTDDEQRCMTFTSASSPSAVKRKPLPTACSST